MALSVARQRAAMRLRGRSYMAFALAPEPPIADWLTDLDLWLRGSPGFFAGRPAVLDLAAVTLTGSAIAHLIAELVDRGIRIMGLEGVAPEKLVPGLPPLLTGGRAASEAAVESWRRTVAADPHPAARDLADRGSSSLLIEANVRSGQSVFHASGDVTVVGSVGSGAEVVAGGSIHIYGTLRGRAMAGTTGDARARIFCRRIEAELLAIDGFYRTADQLDPGLRNRPVQAWLAGETLMIAAIG
jgi:septum site-determining protein MinC